MSDPGSLKGQHFLESTLVSKPLHDCNFYDFSFINAHVCCLYQLGDGFQFKRLFDTKKQLKAVKAIFQLKTTEFESRT